MGRNQLKKRERIQELERELAELQAAAARYVLATAATCTVAPSGKACVLRAYDDLKKALGKGITNM